ncbi:hypothetical protein PS723_02417 [Pseudomonas fluorescens]|uniref:Uncharacterized protein n=1 Tax=Pseudomonas fluorescens TaxID=294 RepID=A0A5E7C233_PSEFL|nr:hypothetical protein PS723_02417 [Pseudomonas fluorescens]
MQFVYLTVMLRTIAPLGPHRSKLETVPLNLGGASTSVTHDFDNHLHLNPAGNLQEDLPQLEVYFQASPVSQPMYLFHSRSHHSTWICGNHILRGFGSKKCVRGREPKGESPTVLMLSQ